MLLVYGANNKSHAGVTYRAFLQFGIHIMSCTLELSAVSVGCHDHFLPITSKEAVEHHVPTYKVEVLKNMGLFGAKLVAPN